MVWPRGNTDGHIDKVSRKMGDCSQVYRFGMANSASYPQQNGKWVLIKRQWQCSAAGKVTVGFASLQDWNRDLGPRDQDETKTFAYISETRSKPLWVSERSLDWDVETKTTSLPTWCKEFYTSFKGTAPQSKEQSFALWDTGREHSLFRPHLHLASPLRMTRWNFDETFCDRKLKPLVCHEALTVWRSV